MNWSKLPYEQSMPRAIQEQPRFQTDDRNTNGALEEQNAFYPHFSAPKNPHHPAFNTENLNRKTAMPQEHGEYAPRFFQPPQFNPFQMQMQQRQQYEQQLQQQNYLKQKQMAQQKMMQQQQLHMQQQQQQMMKAINSNHSSTLNGKNGDARKSDGEDNEEEGMKNDNNVEVRNDNFPQHPDASSGFHAPYPHYPPNRPYTSMQPQMRMKGEMEMRPFYNNQPTSHLQRILQNNHPPHDPTFIPRESNPNFREGFSRPNMHYPPPSNPKDDVPNDKAHKSSTNGTSTDKQKADADADSKNTSSETICYDDDDDGDKNKNDDNNEEDDEDEEEEEDDDTVDEDDNDGKSSSSQNLPMSMQMMPNNNNNISAMNQPNVPNFNPPYNLHPNYYPPQHSLPFPQKRHFNGEPVMPQNYPPPPNYPQPPPNYPQPPPHYQHTMPPSYLHPPRVHTPSMMDNPAVDCGMEMRGSLTDDMRMPIKKIKYDHSYIPIGNFSDPRHFNYCMQRYSKNEAFTRLMEMGGEEGRALFLLDLFTYMDSRNCAINATPTVSKQPLDLFRLYCVVKQLGGMVEVSKGKRWREVSGSLGMGSSSSAGFVVKKNYGRYVFAFECMRDRGNIDPAPLLAFLEQPLKKTNKRTKSILDHPNLDPRVDLSSPRPLEAIRRMSGTPTQQTQPPMYPTHPSLNSIYRGIRPGMKTDFDHLRMGMSPNKRIWVQSRFAAGSVEATRPLNKYKNKLNLATLGHVDTWRLMMALRSGQLAEVNWALNILTALTADHHAFNRLQLSSLPGLLDLLLKHLKIALKTFFGENIQVEMKDKGEKCGDVKNNDHRREIFDKSWMKTASRRKVRRVKDGCLYVVNRKEEFYMGDEKEWDREVCVPDVVFNMEVQRAEEMMKKKFYMRDFSHLNNEDFCYKNIKTKAIDSSIGIKNEDSITCLEKKNIKKEIVEDEKTIKVEDPNEAENTKKDDINEKDELESAEIGRLHGELFCHTDDWDVEVARKCLQLMNIIRNFSFIPSNETLMCQHAPLLFILSSLIMLQSSRDWRTVESLRQDAFVILSNIAGRLDLMQLDDGVVIPLLQGLLHWCTSSSFIASDPDVPRNSTFFPPDFGEVQPSICDLALEAASKFCVVGYNIDLLINTPPFSKITRFIKRLCGFINRAAEGDQQFEDEMMMLTSSLPHFPLSNPVHHSTVALQADWMHKQVNREFSLVLVASLLQADSTLVKVLAEDRNLMSSLLTFIEVQCLRLNMSIITSGAISSDHQFSGQMLRKAVFILLHVAKNSSNLLAYKHRLLTLLHEKLPASYDDDHRSKQPSVACTLKEVLTLCM